MSDLSAAYHRLSRRCTREQLADDYRRARRFGEEPPGREQDVPIRRPIAMLASAVPACATLSVAIHMIHVLPDPAEPGLLYQLLGNAEKHARSRSTVSSRTRDGRAGTRLPCR